MPFRPIQTSQFTVQKDGLPGIYFDTFSGLKDTSQTSDYSDGISNRIYKLFGRKEIDDMTLGKAFDPLMDTTLIKYYKQWCSGVNAATVLSITPIRNCPKPEKIGPVLTLYGVEPISLSFADVDRKSTETSRIELVFVAADWSYQ